MKSQLGLAFYMHFIQRRVNETAINEHVRVGRDFGQFAVEPVHYLIRTRHILTRQRQDVNRVRQFLDLGAGVVLAGLDEMVKVGRRDSGVAPYTVYDDTTALETVLVDQRHGRSASDDEAVCRGLRAGR